MRQRVVSYRRVAPVVLALASMAAGGIVAGCSPGSQPTGSTSQVSGAARPTGSWPYPNGDLTNTRDAVSSVISSSNIASLKEAWSFKLSGTAAQGVSYAGSFAANPVVVDGVVYLQDLYANVYAISLSTGQLKWEYQANLAEKSGPGPDGVAVANGVVYGDTSTDVFALKAATGAVIWDDKSLLNSGQGAFEIQPAVAGGRVYLASAYGSGPGGGVLLALDAATGKLRWYYQAVPNDFKDYDIQLSPIAATVHGVPAIIAGGKMGDVYAFSSATGALLWKTPVGVHNGHDNDSALLLAHKLTITFPYTFEPGPLGGVLTDMAVADGCVYLATIDLPLTAKTAAAVNGGSSAGVAPSGEIEALNLATGKVEWDTRAPTLPLGAATVSNDLVFTTLDNGELLALNRATGAIVHEQKLPATTNAPIAVTRNTILIPAGAPRTSATGSPGTPQLVAYTVQ